MSEMTKAQFIDRAATAISGSADDLRAKGMAVAVHNDYRQGDKPHTFWLLVDKNMRAWKGEGETDGEALDNIRKQYAEATDKLHHAPMCPANHYHGGRVPSGACSCGAVALAATEDTR